MTILRYLARDNLAAMHGALVDRCVQFGEDGCRLLDSSAWTLEHLPRHLLKAACPEQAKALQLDFEWLSTKLAEHGVQAIIADTRLIEYAELARLGRVLRLSAHVLAREYGQLAPQLLGRVHEALGSGTEKLLARACRKLPQNVLFPSGGKHLTEPGSLFALLVGHGASVMGALLLPDGARALSWSNDGTLRLWDLESGQGRAMEGHGGSVLGALLLPDGAISWSWDETLRLWDLESRGELKSFIGDDVITTVAFSSERQLLLAGDRRGRVMFFPFTE